MICCLGFPSNWVRLWWTHLCGKQTREEGSSSSKWNIPTDIVWEGPDVVPPSEKRGNVWFPTFVSKHASCMITALHTSANFISVRTQLSRSLTGWHCLCSPAVPLHWNKQLPIRTAVHMRRKQSPETVGGTSGGDTTFTVIYVNSDSKNYALCKLCNCKCFSSNNSSNMCIHM